MTNPLSPAERLLQQLSAKRKASGKSVEELAKDLILGPGWIERFESGKTLPDLDMFFVLADRIGINPDTLFHGLRTPNDHEPEAKRLIFGIQAGKDLEVHFRYANFDAVYVLNGATIKEFNEVLLTLRNGLAGKKNSEDIQKIKTNAVAQMFLQAVELWPNANPSDLWWFVVYRAYCDPYNHPASSALLSFDQSWKRTGGWALEEIMVCHYGPELAKHGIKIEIARGDRKQKLVEQFKVDGRLEADKVDVYLVGPGDRVFGAVHVKASFAERRTDDVPMSQALIRGGYFSPLWTMDCKSRPSAHPFNQGELGATHGHRSAKRKDIEDDELFSACFSYNENTLPTPKGEKTKARIINCNFSNPNDAFVDKILAAWKKFSS